jgi:uncharacterized membrane protein YphA (DoxX/SURF4 family)
VEAVALGGRFALGWFFVLAGVTKLADLGAFENAVRNYQILPPRLVRPVARLLPATEIAAGALMGAGVAVEQVGILLALLLLTFAIAISVNLVRGRRIDCGCFIGLGSKRISWSAVARNVLLASVAVTVAAVSPRALALPVFGSSPPETTLSQSDAIAVLLTTMGALIIVPLLLEWLRVRRKLPFGGA